MEKIKAWIVSEDTKIALIFTTAILLAVFGVIKFLQTEEVLWMTLAIPLFALIAA